MREGTASTHAPLLTRKKKKKITSLPFYFTGNAKDESLILPSLPYFL
jgi:hypothetical protein